MNPFRPPSFLKRTSNWALLLLLAVPNGALSQTITNLIVLGSSINDGTTQRSTVTNLTLTLNQPALLSVESLLLRKLTASNTVSSTNLALTYNTTNGHARSTFPGLPGRTLSDGNYIASLSGQTVATNGTTRLDGNADGRPGDPFTFEFHRYFGDVNGDRDVDFW